MKQRRSEEKMWHCNIGALFFADALFFPLHRQEPAKQSADDGT